jgi:hypothetical protein
MTVGAVVLCGLVLLVSSVSKLRSGTDYAEFVASVPAFGFPVRWARPFAAATVVAEVLITALLLPATVLLVVGGPRWPAVSGLVCAVGLFGVLTAAVWRAVARRTGAVCRCFGAAKAVLGRRHVVRNALLLLVAVLGLAIPVESVDPLVAAAAGALGAVLVIRFDDLAELFAG